jgi:two-component system, LuxR family, response regulator FixJ
MTENATVFIVDDDAAVRDSLARLLAAAGDYAVEMYDSAEAFLDQLDRVRAGCVLLDMQLPGMNGLETQKALAAHEVHLPIIFLTAHGCVPTAVRALKDGAFEFLEKPADSGALIACVKKAMQRDAERRREAAVHESLRARCATLTAREREILPLATSGRSSKEIARALGISHRTIELHRARIMKKIGAHSLIDLVQAVPFCNDSAAPSRGDPVDSSETL